MANTRPLLSGGMDPTGSVYEQDGSIYRSINPEFISFFRSLLNNKTIQKMIGREFVDTSIATEDNINGTLLLKHQKISPTNYSYEWSSEMLHDAARFSLQICLDLLEEDLILKDATPWNVVFNAGNPVFVDFASIMPVDSNLVWVALDQFSRLFLFPLLAAEQGLGRVNRSLMQTSQKGISSSELGDFLPGFSWIKKPWLIKRVYIPHMLVALLQKTGQDKEIGKHIKKVTVSKQARIKFLNDLLSDLNSIHLTDGKSRWSNYYKNIDSFFDPNRFSQKQKVVSKLLQDLKPKTVTDIGSNMGGYAVLAAQNGAFVTAFDTDEDSISMFYRLIKDKKLNILPLVLDVTNPSPPTGWRAIQYPPAIKRFKSEGALALALVHHLAITQGQAFDRIVDELVDYCDKWLITEFVPPEDPRTKEILLTSRRDMSWYSLEGYLAELNKKFKKTTTFDSYPSGRTLILCEDKF